ncbi:MAG TPA: M48 family metallopeptidase [Vicinamibacterales bacterium]
MSDDPSFSSTPDDPHAPTVVGSGASLGRPVVPPVPQNAGRSSWVPLAVFFGVLVLLVVAAYLYAIPFAARLALAAVPTSVDRTIGDLSFQSIDGHLLRPSRLPESEQARLRSAFERAVMRADGNDVVPTTLVFRASEIGPNAFALPGGRMVVTDELVELVDGREDVVIGVLGHEYGHVKARHGVRMVAQSALLRTVTSLVLGDFSSVLAAAPALLGEQAYSRDFEREADAESVRILRAAGASPGAMVVFFEKLAAKELGNTGGLAIAFASHPADAERVDFFRRAATVQ